MNAAWVKIFLISADQPFLFYIYIYIQFEILFNEKKNCVFKIRNVEMLFFVWNNYNIKYYWIEKTIEICIYFIWIKIYHTLTNASLDVIIETKLRS